MTTFCARTALLLLATVLAAGADAQTSPHPTPPPKAKPTIPAPPPADPAYEAAKSAFESLPDPVRKGIQDALVWTGDYNAVTAGTFGRRTYDGIVAWQKRSKAEASGILTAPQRAALDAAGEAARSAARFKVQADAASGAVIGVPERTLSKRSAQPGGSRWQSADGRITLDTKSFKPGETDLDALFEQKTAPGTDRKISYKLKKPDFIVVTGETATGRFYIRYAAGEGGIRGFTIGYDKALASEADRLVIAVANGFIPFPDAPPTIETAMVPAAPVLPSATPRPPARPGATGLVVAPGRVLTTAAALETCPDSSIAGRPARIAQRDASGALILLDVERGPGTAPGGVSPALRADGPKPDEALVVLGAEPKGPPSVAPGIATGGNVSAPLQPGAAGAPVLDRSGRLVGLVARFPTAPRLIAGVMPPTSYAMIPANAVSAFLIQNGIQAGIAKTPAAATLGAAAAPLVEAVVGIACGR